MAGVLALLLSLVALSAVAVPVMPVDAAKGGSCNEGFSVITGGQTYSGDQDRLIPANQVGSTIQVRGKFVRFNVAAATFAVRNYTFTGANSSRPDKDLPLDGPSVVFVSKVPQHGTTLTSAVELDLNNEGVVLRRSDGRQDVKIQAKDCPSGGLFQMEVEPGVREVNTLGADYHYTSQPAGQERLCFVHNDGLFSGYDSPQLAQLVTNTETRAVWNVQSGGRIGMVVGEDAVEGGCRP
jgi:hypothetical protein